MSLLVLLNLLFHFLLHFSFPEAQNVLWVNLDPSWAIHTCTRTYVRWSPGFRIVLLKWFFALSQAKRMLLNFILWNAQDFRRVHLRLHTLSLKWVVFKQWFIGFLVKNIFKLIAIFHKFFEILERFYVFFWIFYYRFFKNIRSFNNAILVRKVNILAYPSFVHKFINFYWLINLLYIAKTISIAENWHRIWRFYVLYY